MKSTYGYQAYEGRSPTHPCLFLISYPYVGFDETRKSLKGEQLIGLPSRVMTILLRLPPIWQGIE